MLVLQALSSKAVPRPQSRCWSRCMPKLRELDGLYCNPCSTSFPPTGLAPACLPTHRARFSSPFGEMYEPHEPPGIAPEGLIDVRILNAFVGECSQRVLGQGLHRRAPCLKDCPFHRCHPVVSSASNFVAVPTRPSSAYSLPLALKLHAKAHRRATCLSCCTYADSPDLHRLPAAGVCTLSSSYARTRFHTAAKAANASSRQPGLHAHVRTF